MNKVFSLIRRDQHVLVGFSGGVDSTVLLHILYRIKNYRFKDLNIRAVYVNHRTGSNYKELEIHCKKFCSKLSIEFLSEKISFSNLSQSKNELFLRNERYKIFKKIHIKKEVVLTAHHLNDQVETFFLALKRGSGPLGLSAMSKVSNSFGFLLKRPLLNCLKQELIIYAKLNNLIWVEDESNKDIRYDRNYIRKYVIPLFEKRWKNFSKIAFRSIELCSEQENLINELLNDKLLKLVVRKNSLNFAPLVGYSKYLINAIIRRWLKINHILMPSRLQLEKILNEVILARSDSRPRFFLSKYWFISRYKSRIWLLPVFNNISNVSLLWDVTKILKLPDNLGFFIPSKVERCGFRKPLINEIVIVKFKLHGKINIFGKDYTRKVKEIWRRFSVPYWLRERIPFIYYNNSLVSAFGIFVTDFGRFNNEKDELKVKWLNKENFFNYML